jgi:hypothetical protein
MSSSDAFVAALVADGPAPGLGDRMGVFGRFVGSWDLTVTDVGPDGTEAVAEGEWHFAWALGGRAVQDVWVVPGLAAPDPGSVEHGSALRAYDPSTDRWTVSWTGPVKQRFHRFDAAVEGDEVVLRSVDGPPHLRWVFSDVTPDRFRWRHERSDDGEAWVLVQWMDVRRRA